jgi:hypothetical protein
MLPTVALVQGVELDQDELAQRIAECNAITGGEDRLECFDAIAEIQSDTAAPEEIADQSTQSSSSDTEAHASGEVAAATTATTAAIADSPGGKYLESGTSEVPKADKSFDLQLVDTSKDVYDRWVFEFADGQVWRQSSKKHVTVPKNLPVTATIRKGILGSHKLRFGDSGSRIAVKRVK